ncbi:hypothetical protein BJ166DRAFT_542481 [Pestalotiopsis sp. NC0098]|nr:hypothetical protein BJ166DRAFT_542481 [Pestalotiopsis sp. NC0098]
MGRNNEPSFNNNIKESARLAQSVERETLNLKAAGSTPALGSIPDASQSLRYFAFFFAFSHFLLDMPPLTRKSHMNWFICLGAPDHSFAR